MVTPSTSQVSKTETGKDLLSATLSSTTTPTVPATTTTNWASVLQSSAPIVNKKIVKHIRNKSSISSSTSSSLLPSNPSTPIQPSKSSSLNIPNNFNINNESSQPLGVLLLRVMYDTNYSLFSDRLSLFNITTKGLTNTGNICYMNSILQILIYCEPFNRLFKLIEDKSIGNLSKTSPTPLLDATIKFINEFVDLPSSQNDVKKSDESPKAISPETFYMNLINHKKFSHLKWGQQEDAEEFLGYYLDGLNEEFVDAIKKLNTPNIDSLIQNFSNNCDDVEKVSQFKYNVKTTVNLIKNEKKSKSNGNNDDDGWNEVGSNNKSISINKAVEVEPSPINLIFGGQFKSVLTIPKSPNSNQFKKSITFDPFQNLQLDISEANSIEDAFNHLNDIEKISFKASKQDKEIQIKKQTFIDKLPQVLIIHLKRFSFLKEKDVGIEKLRKRVDYNHDLNIPTNILSNKGLSEEMGNIYRLIGVVYHHGSSAEGGHYTCDVLKKSNTITNKVEWVRIDDTLIKTISEDEVLGGPEENIKNAYILLYERK
ncbi:hypothetical protein DFJ63DRAFT_285159 [Scheffersomyces coipomensis]|uniref:uncharacterized protein n=1 Tax=Scheffersomyces coipomensis TaxID=1788519 RepID=UPI00315C6ABB